MKYLPSPEVDGMYRYEPLRFSTNNLYFIVLIYTDLYQQKFVLTDTAYKTVYSLLHMIKYSKNVNVFHIFILLHGQSIPGYAQEKGYIV